MIPIFKNMGTKAAPWSMVKEIKVDKLITFMRIFKSAESIYSLDRVFLNSIIYNKELQEPYIAEFDVSKTKMDATTYQNQIEKLVKKANDILVDKGKKSKWLNNYKYDIMGSFTTGIIILMDKK